MTIKRIKPGPRLSQAVVHGDTVYIAGQVAEDKSRDVTGQTRQILAQIDRLLAQAGSSRVRLLWVNIWLADMTDFAAMNAVWEAWIPPGQTPARATVESRLAGPQFKVEIAVTAAKNPNKAAARRPKSRARRRKP